LIAYAIAVGVREHGSELESWRILFLVAGLLTIALGICFFYMIPDNQFNARWLTKDDRILAVERVRINQQGIGNKHFKMYQFKEALKDPMTWAFCLFAVLFDVPNGGITNFFSQLVTTLSLQFHYTLHQLKYHRFKTSDSPLSRACSTGLPLVLC
jgi:MFS transporter, ACS family, allantoate permease